MKNTYFFLSLCLSLNKTEGHHRMMFMIKSSKQLKKEVKTLSHFSPTYSCPITV